MAKKEVKSFEDGGMHTGTEAWNIAQYFTGFSIALPLKELNDLEDIARFGVVKIDEELQMGDDQFDKRRADAVKRYQQKLRQVVADTMFKVKKRDKDDAEKILEWLRKVPKYFNGLLSIKTNSVSHDDQIKVNEEFLTKLLDLLVEKKQKYLEILDRTGLIFREVDEVDLDKLTNEFSQGG